MLRSLRVRVGNDEAAAWAALVASLGEFPLDVGPQIRTGLVGIVSFGVAWLWSLLTSLEALRRARRG